MIKKSLSLITLTSIIFAQCGPVAFAEILEDDMAIQSFKDQNLSKAVFKQEIIEDEFAQKTLGDKNLSKLIFKYEPIEDTIPVSQHKPLLKSSATYDVIEDRVAAKSFSSQNLEKPVFNYKLIDENAEMVRVPIMPARYIVTKEGVSEGQKVKFVVVKDIRRNGDLYIKKGTPVEAIIETITKPSMGGDPSQIIIGRFTAKNTKGNKIDLTGEIQKNGANRATWIKPLAYIGYCVPVFGTPLLGLLLIKGGHAKITPRQEFVLYYE